MIDIAPKNWRYELDEYELARFEEEWERALSTPINTGYARVFSGNDLIYSTEIEDYV